MANDPEWLRERFQNAVVDDPHLNGNVLNFRGSEPPKRDQSATALQLVDQAAEIFTGIEDHARQLEARAQSLIKSAVERMKFLEGQVEAVARELKIAQSRLATSEAQLSDAERRAETAEVRERELEYALSRIEDAIRKRLLGMEIGGKRNAAA